LHGAGNQHNRMVLLQEMMFDNLRKISKNLKKLGGDLWSK
jgi:hypothetical protein